MEIADKGTRLGNYIIDTILVILVIMFITYFLQFRYPAILDENSKLLKVVFSATFFSYYFFFELIYGATPGKFMTKTIVVDKNGDKPHWGYLIIRTVARMIPIEALTFLFGYSGLHDLLSKTKVVTSNRKSA